ncbi:MULTISPECIES: BPSL0067 family protein [Burkholderia cepacia complex]|uniref:BPSL0067 family protein n=1 Tax=Burkholderia cepacia complex TaxID=87882 RepID=UPI0023DDD864|nr:MULTISPECIES: BPSL0067 family protein [Burkholderia cepacia complex]MDF3092668.1 BPSL0067 family protein [Burkholderia semiarida]MDF3108201.1 BPSL0067 family protein [Burkholderia semiarida]WJN77238.1 hypothetical protein OH687_10355 [Burkholderia anthina]
MSTPAREHLSRVVHIAIPYASHIRTAIKRRCIAFKGKDQTGRYIDPSNNADAFSVVK